jgi:DNA mismatch repair ATPase MutS
MANEIENQENDLHLVDLLYPSETKRREAQDRATAIAKLPQDYVTNLELELLSRLICPENALNAQRILTQLSTDEEVLNYRLDILEDFLNVPQLEAVLYENVHKLYVNEHVNIQKLGLADSFYALNTRLNSLKTFIECITNCHEFCQKFQDRFHSEALKGLVEYFASVYNSEYFDEVKRETDECLRVLAKGVKSVTVGINFDDMMRPVEAMLLSVSTDSIKKKGRFDWIFKHLDGGADRAIGRTHSLYNENGGTNDLEAPLFRELKEINSEYISHLDRAIRAYFKKSTEDILTFESQMSFYIGAKRIIDAVRARGLEMCRPKYLKMDERRLDAKGVFDLSFYTQMVSSDPMGTLKDKIITNDCKMDDDGRFFVLTGANNGGKTTYTRAIGIIQVMAQAGIYVPCTSCEISPVDFIYTHFPKEEEVGLNTSRFTQECKQFKVTVDNATRYSMLLLNESIQSTTPTECVFIATELTKIFRCIGVRGVYATHLLELAKNLDKLNAEVEGDTKLVSIVTTVDTTADNKRLYRIVRSAPQEFGYAQTIYKKFGVSFEEVQKRMKNS